MLAIATTNIAPQLNGSVPDDSTMQLGSPPSYAAIATSASSPLPLAFEREKSEYRAISQQPPTPPPTLTRHRFLVSSDNPKLVTQLAQWLADLRVTRDQEVTVVDGTAVKLHTTVADKKSFLLRWAESTGQSMETLVDMAQDTASALFGTTVEKLKLIESGEGDKNQPVSIELVQVPTPSVLHTLNKENPLGYLEMFLQALALAYSNDGTPNGLIYIIDFGVGVDFASLDAVAEFVEHFGALCPHLTVILSGYDPNDVIMHGGEYLDMTQYVRKIKTHLNRPEMNVRVIPVTFTQSRTKRPLRRVFFHQQRIVLLNEFARIAAGLCSRAQTTRIRKMEPIRGWNKSILACIDVVRSKLATSQTLIQKRTADFAAASTLANDKIALHAQKIKELQAKVDRPLFSRQTVWQLVPILAFLLGRAVGWIACALIDTVACVVVLLVTLLVNPFAKGVAASVDAAERIRLAQEQVEVAGRELKDVQSKIAIATQQLMNVGTWIATLDQHRIDVIDDTVSVATLLAMRDPLLRLAPLVPKGSSPSLSDFGDLVVAYLHDQGKANELRAVLHALVTQPVEQEPPINLSFDPWFTPPAAPFDASKTVACAPLVAIPQERSQETAFTHYQGVPSASTLADLLLLAREDAPPGTDK
ncbi:hypothetical protein AMAG_00049 [Allomyces macrogynus ATCC 38327]|uniref:Uncharacterized protein n=1 Tax=Allomyces macrogynus (strain ATCC 38327) TaxID=578462 RepID=A0A0L0RVF1_ALLM3|nr:hypothetical protein AMAG_00049 [Allomyces macrogynus ATCC 38327]|eukprot:KNE54046.1 hypothetical protein AMAG_00049 [Allomyces macrogynus ATCC 38327]